MSNLAHIAETAALLLAAYLLGCIIGYGLRRILYAARGTRQVSVAPVLASPTPEPRLSRSPAARLAASVDAEPLNTPPAKPRAKPKSPDSKPLMLSAPRGGVSDNLKQIKGIGPKIESSLQALGIFHFDQIAGWTKANVDWVDAQLAFKGRIQREGWVRQAQELSQAKAEA